jgi:monoamine oxidase
MKRREFIRTTALATSALAIHHTFAIGKKLKTIVIGAGFSGLAAAYRLHQRKSDFIVLESRNRIGGRVFSHVLDQPENLVVELGAEWVGESHTRLRQLCDELKLPLDNNQMDTHLFFDDQYRKNGEWDFSEDWKKKFEQIKKNYATLTATQKNELDKMDWWRYLNNNGCDGFDLMVRELGDSTDFGESIRHVSALAALSEYAESSNKDEMDFKISGGNNMLAKSILEKIGVEKLKLEYTVTKVVQSNSGVEVHCSNGEKFEGDKIICSIPTFSLKKIDWQPSLPKEKVDAINALQYARINKNPMLFTSRFWGTENFDLLTDMPAHYFYHGTKNQRSSKGALISYTIGDKADVFGHLSNEERLAITQLSLQGVFGSITPFYEKQVNYNWGEDPYSKGAYAIYKPGQWKSAQVILKKHFLHTHFAGEHLADWQGFMEGAINSGEEAAEAIL